VNCQSAVEMIPVPANKFNHVHVDIVGPMHTAARGERYMLTMIDRTSRWSEVVPMLDITAERFADSFVEGWVSRFGVVETRFRRMVISSPISFLNSGTSRSTRGGSDWRIERGVQRAYFIINSPACLT
jgi:hypothetical protein